MDINKASYDLVNKIQASFDIFMDNFQTATTLLFNIISTVAIEFASSVQVKLTSTITIKKIRLIVSQVKLSTTITQTINAKRVSITYSIKERMKAVTMLNQLLPITFVSKANQKIVSTIYQGVLSLSAVPVLAAFFVLGDYDGETLGTLDTETLGALDYVAS